GGSSSTSSQQKSGPAATARISPAPDETYPTPHWPSYFKPAKSIDDLMPTARTLVHNQSGLQGKGMAMLQAGESVLIVAANEADPMVLEAIKKALVERKVTPFIKMTYEMTGVSKEEAAADRAARTKGQNTEEAGIYQASQ